MAQPRVFVSYSHQDVAFTQRLVADLRDTGAEVWFDVSGIDHGDFLKRINEALRQCEWLVLVLTPSAIESPYVQMEVNAALHRVQQGLMRAAIPMLAVDCPPNTIPALWDVLHRYDATRDYQGALAGVLRAIGQAPDSATLSPAATMPADRLPPRLARLGFEGKFINSAEVIIPPMCAVPAGEFLMGPDPGQQNAVHQRVTLPAYQIGRYPATVAEYACFVRAGHPEPRNWQQQLGRFDHPVANVSWHDATAYTAWLTQVSNQLWRLPTESEWEKAARWEVGIGHARVYPWGDVFDLNRCNMVGSTSQAMVRWLGMRSKGTTTPVGSYAEAGDASPYGAHDMAGNVWEWTNKVRGPRPYNADMERALADTFAGLMCGGSFGEPPYAARVNYRAGQDPGHIADTIGFRVLRAEPSGS